MARFYKGVGVGTFLHSPAHDPRIHGIVPRNPGGPFNPNVVMSHVAYGTINTPLISLTRSYGVAHDYAVDGSVVVPTAANPAYVFEIDIPDDPDSPGNPLGGFTIFDPVWVVASHNNNALMSPSYHHDGDMGYLHGVVDPIGMAAILLQPALRPPGAAPYAIPPRLTDELLTIVSSLRDAELLVRGVIPSNLVMNRHLIH
jgi:hypothetical protein